MEDKKVQKLKFLILGDSSVGKTSMLLRFIEDTFNATTIYTVGIDYKSKYISHNNKKYELQIWDTAGQERFRGITKNYYKKSDGIILVYDIMKRETFLNVKGWINSLKDALDLTQVGVVLCGNKCDCKPEERQVTVDEGKKISEEHGLKFFETSCKSNINVNEAFISLVDTWNKTGVKDKKGGGKLKNKTDGNKKCC